MLKITYLYHSGFSVELEHCVLLFDYYKGELPNWDEKKAIYIFVSHKHKDHFNMKIFDLLSQYRDVHFFLGSDVKLSAKYLERNQISPIVKEKITNVGKNKEILFEHIEIKTLRSTDAGVAYIVKAEGKYIYHAGDLNWWHWRGAVFPFNENMAKNYKKEIDSIKEMEFDVAFIPLDPRLEDAYGFGMDYFLGKIKVSHVFPMHMWEEYHYICKYKKTETGRAFGDKIIEITAEGQEFELWNI